MSTRQPHNQAIALILLAFVGVSLAYSVVNPLHEATDELRHYRFVRYVTTEHALPVQGEVGCSAQGHHPPLFYALAALLTGWVDTGQPVCATPETNPFWAYRYWEVGRDNKNQYLHTADEAFPWRGAALAAHLARAVNVLIGAGVVWLTWAIARAIWPGRPWLGVGAAAIVAFNPMFGFMSGAINNDVIAAFSGAAVTLACVRLLRDEAGLQPRWGVLLGTLFGIALLSKFNLAAIAVTIETAVTLTALRRRQWRRWWQVNLLIAGTTLLLAGWWFVRNQLLYGEPTGVERLTELWGVRDPSESWGVAIFELPYVWTSLWGRFGYGQVPLPQPVYAGLWWLALFAIAGLLLPVGRWLRRRPPLSLAAVWPALPLLLLGLNVALFFAVIFNYLLISPAGPMGRFFFPALPSLAVLLIYGLSQWGQLLAARGQTAVSPTPARIPALGVSLALLALTLTALFGYLAPAYARPAAWAADTAVPNPVNAQFDTLVNLRGYEVGQTAVRPGEPIDVTLYWEVTGRPPGNFLLFVHLQDDVGMVAQRDTHPGLGHFPSSQWQPGDRFVERIRLFVPETAYTPAAATLRIGLYAPQEGYRLGITAPDGSGLGDALTLGMIQIETPPDAAQPNPLRQNFGGDVALVGYAYSQRTLTAGAPLTVTLHWAGLAAQPADYLIEVHLRQPPGDPWQTVARADVRPQPPTDSWQPAQPIVTTHVLETAVPPGDYLIHVALIDRRSGAAQNIVADDGHWIDNHLLLGRVRIVE
ncbi:MAG: glycosyltransferase family 39 protein [Anaerolineales bacterium]|nr:glycosyltransferase family 39 protein [Anaerolineales bacterium]